MNAFTKIFIKSPFLLVIIVAWIIYGIIVYKTKKLELLEDVCFLTLLYGFFKFLLVLAEKGGDC